MWPQAYKCWPQALRHRNIQTCILNSLGKDDWIYGRWIVHDIVISSYRSLENMPIIERVTMFKVSDKAARTRLLQAYDVMKANARKVIHVLPIAIQDDVADV